MTKGNKLLLLIGIWLFTAGLLVLGGWWYSRGMTDFLPGGEVEAADFLVGGRTRYTLPEGLTLLTLDTRSEVVTICRGEGNAPTLTCRQGLWGRMTVTRTGTTVTAARPAFTGWRKLLPRDPAAEAVLTLPADWKGTLEITAAGGIVCEAPGSFVTLTLDGLSGDVTLSGADCAGAVTLTGNNLTCRDTRADTLTLTAGAEADCRDCTLREAVLTGQGALYLAGLTADTLTVSSREGGITAEGLRADTLRMTAGGTLTLTRTAGHFLYLETAGETLTAELLGDPAAYAFSAEGKDAALPVSGEKPTYTVTLVNPAGTIRCTMTPEE